MKKTLILLLTFLPLTLLAQELKCCESVKDIETYLNGNWKKKDSDLNKLYQYKFDNEKRESRIFTINNDGTLELITNSESITKILRTEKGYKVEHNWGKLKTYEGIKYLDSTKLIVTRRDGKEAVMYRVSE